MRQKKPARIHVLSIALFLISLTGEYVKADPYYFDCSSGTCTLIELEQGNYVLACADSNAILYAVDPNGPIDLTGATFQWYVWVRANENNGWVDEWATAIGGTSNRFEVTDNEEFEYYCEVNTSGGSWSTSSITIGYAPNDVSIGSAPDDLTVCPGDPVELYSTGSGSYADKLWQRMRPGEDWEGLAGETSEYLNFTEYNEPDGTRFRYSVSNVCARVYSRAAIISYHDAPEITGNIAGTSKCEGSSANFSISANGSQLSYHWQESQDAGNSWSDIVNGGIYSASDNNLSVSDLIPDMDRYLYRCVVSGICSLSDSSANGSLTVWQKPYLLRQPSGVTGCEGEQVMLHARAGGTEPVLYQWRKGGISVTSPSTDTSFVIARAGTSDAGNYLVRLTNQCTASPVESDAATLTVRSAPSITDQPDDLEFCQGAVPSVQFSFAAGGDNLSFQWQMSEDKGGSWSGLTEISPYSGTTGTSLTLQSPSPSISGRLYRCLITGACNAPVSTDSARLTIKTAPDILIPPQNAAACLGEEASFSVRVTGSEPLSFQWKGNNQSLTDWISDTLYILESVNFGDAKNYHVTVKNECNTTGISSDAAELTVNAVPVVDLGADVHLCPGDKAFLNAGSGYARYAWNTGDSSRAIEVGSQLTVSLQVWNSEGCSSGDDINIILDPSLPDMDLGGDRSFCAGTEVTLDAGGLYDNFEWQDGSAGQSLKLGTSGLYYVSAWRNNSSCVVSDTVEMVFSEPYNEDYICMVTTDLATGDNLIIWEKTPDQGTAAYQVFRQTNVINQYEIIGTVPYDRLSMFRDTIADPEQRQWVYKITAVDTCGNVSDISDAIYHKPLFLQYQSSVDGVNLSWEKYEVEGSTMDFVSYEIYRGSDSTSLELINSLSSDLRVFKDTDPNAMKYRYFYRIAGVKAVPCYPSGEFKAGTGPYQHSLSNLEDNKLKENPTSGRGMFEVRPLEMYPNPMTDYTVIRFSNPDKGSYSLNIKDLSGKILRTEKIAGTGEYNLYRENLNPGYYIVELTGTRAYRGKLIIR